MKFIASNYDDLIDAMTGLDEDDRIQFNITKDLHNPQLADKYIALRISPRGIFVHELKGFKEEESNG